MQGPVRSPQRADGGEGLMAWGRIDDAFDDHPKVLALLDMEGAAAAVGLWTLCFTWAHRNTRKKGKTPGLIPASLPRRFFGPEARDMASLLVEVGLWDAVPEGGWVFHDFADYLPGKEISEARSAAGKRGAAKRWGSKETSHEDQPMAEVKQADGSAMAPPWQDDGKLPSDDGSEPSSDDNGLASDGSRAGAHREWAWVGSKASDRTSDLSPQTAPAPAEPLASGEGVLIDLVDAKKPKGPEPGSDDDPKWLRFWAVFPNKVSKKDARDKWAKAIKSGVDPDAIIGGAIRYAGLVRRERREKAKIKDPSGWLNGARWEDEIDEAPAAGEFGYQEVAAWSPYRD